MTPENPPVGGLETLPAYPLYRCLLRRSEAIYPPTYPGRHPRLQRARQ